MDIIDKLIVSLITDQANEYSLDKERTSNDDSLDALRFSTNDHEFLSPTGVTVDPYGNVFVCEAAGHMVKMFDGNGNFITRFGSAGSANGELEWPFGIAIDSKQKVFVADTLNHRIQVFRDSIAA